MTSGPGVQPRAPFGVLSFRLRAPRFGHPARLNRPKTCRLASAPSCPLDVPAPYRPPVYPTTRPVRSAGCEAKEPPVDDDVGQTIVKQEGRRDAGGQAREHPSRLEGRG
jgi:hypothetical protein